MAAALLFATEPLVVDLLLVVGSAFAGCAAGALDLLLVIGAVSVLETSIVVGLDRVTLVFAGASSVLTFLEDLVATSSPVKD